MGTQRLPAGGAKRGSSVGASTELAGGGRDVRHCVRRRCLVSQPQCAGAVSPADVRGKRQQLYCGVRAAEHPGVRPAATHSPPWRWGQFCASHFSKMLNIVSCSKEDGCRLIIQLLLACLTPRLRSAGRRQLCHLAEPVLSLVLSEFPIKDDRDKCWSALIQHLLEAGRRTLPLCGALL